MQKALSMAAAIAALTIVAGCATGDNEGTLVAPHGAVFGKAPPGPTDPTATFWFPLADAELGLQSDHLFTSGDSSAYASGVCGVSSKMFATTAASNSGDATMQTDNPTNKAHNCSAYPRKLHLILRDDGGNVVTQATTTMFMNVHDLENTTDIIPIGGPPVLRGFALSEDPHCNGLRWTLVKPDQTPSGADQVLVTRTSANTWAVQTQPAPNDKAYCVGDGQLYHVPVHLTVVTDRALP